MVSFVKSSGYQSYTDYWRLVELGGFRVVDLNEADFDDLNATYIVTFWDGHLQTVFEKPTRARVILWHLEWTRERPQAPGVDEVWVSDYEYAQKLGARFVPFGSHPDLIPTKNAPDENAWDVCTLAYAQHGSRRWKVQQQLKQAGIKFAPNGWGKEREDILRNSRLMLHIHQHGDYPHIPVQRFAIAASARIPLVSETIKNPFPLVDGEDFVMFDYGSAPKNGDWDEGVGAESLHQKLCHEYRFDKVVHNVLC